MQVLIICSRIGQMQSDACFRNFVGICDMPGALDVEISFSESRKILKNQYHYDPYYRQYQAHCQDA
jgi:hypothetical protein